MNKLPFQKALCLVLIVLMLVSTLGACSALSPRDPLELQNFLDLMEEKGFDIVDYTIALTGELEELIALYLIAISPNESYQIEFIKLHTIAGAQSVFAGTRESAEALRGNASSHSSVSGVNHNTFHLTSAGLYSHLLQVDDIFVFVLGADAGYRDEIRTIFDLLS